MHFTPTSDYQHTYENAMSDIVTYWNQFPKEDIHLKKKSDQRFKWLSIYRNTVQAHWEPISPQWLHWLHKSSFTSTQNATPDQQDSNIDSQNIEDFFFPALNKTNTVIEHLTAILPDTANVNKILSVLVAAYMDRSNPIPYEENTDGKGLYSILVDDPHKLPPSKCRTYAQVFLPLGLNHAGLKAQKMQDLAESQPLFRHALYLDIFLNGIIHEYQAGRCDIHASVYLFESKSNLLKLYFRYDLDDLMSLSKNDLYEKLNAALCKDLYYPLGYIPFGIRLLYMLCIKESDDKESADKLFKAYYGDFNGDNMLFSPLEMANLSDLGYNASPIDDNNEGENEEDDGQDDDEDDEDDGADDGEDDDEDDGEDDDADDDADDGADDDDDKSEAIFLLDHLTKYNEQFDLLLHTYAMLGKVTTPSDASSKTITHAIDNSAAILKELDNLIAKSNDLKKAVQALKSSRADGQMGKDKS